MRLTDVENRCLLRKAQTNRTQIHTLDYLYSCDIIKRIQAGVIYIMKMSNNNLQFFSWDEDKGIANKKKHGISFREAASVFTDPNILIKHDDDHYEDEDRFIIIGLSEKPRLLVVCHCYRENDTIIRIISARKATVNESAEYTRGR